MKRFFHLLYFLFIFVCVSAQTRNEYLPVDISLLNDSLTKLYAPDNRVAIFKINYKVEGQNVTLSGMTTSSEAHVALVNALRANTYTVIDSVTVLPDEQQLGEKVWGIVNMSVCNLRTNGDYDAGQTSQALLGMPLRILRKDGWLQVQTPDNYISWVLSSALVRVTEEEMHAWNEAKKVVVTAIYGFVYSLPDENSQTVSDVVASDRLRLVAEKDNFYEVSYPDGRKGFISKSICMPLEKWRENIKKDAESIIATGKRMIGIPYMWGGTSTKGMDCSGFIRTTLLQHDIILPRDASQQAYRGEHIDIASDFSNLKPGDLLFFGKKAMKGGKAHVSHVGMYMGNKHFIHSLGWVHISSFNPKDAEYDEYDLNRLLWAQRILPYINKDAELNTTDRNPYYK